VQATACWISGAKPIARSWATIRARTPAAALGAGGTTAALRVRRLLVPHRPLGRARATLTSTTVAVLLALPVIGLAAPALATGHLHYCPPGSVAAATMR